MSRILRRPMFRGGRVESRGTGITSGFVKPKRGSVDESGRYSVTKEEMDEYLQTQKQIRESLRPTPGLSMSDYLRIASAGAEIAGAPGEGPGLKGLFTAASKPLSRLGTDLATSIERRNALAASEASDITQAIIKSRSVKQGQTFALDSKLRQLQTSLTELGEIEDQLAKVTDEAERTKLLRRKGYLESAIEVISPKSDPVVESFMKSGRAGQFWNGIIMEVEAETKKSQNDPNFPWNQVIQKAKTMAKKDVGISSTTPQYKNGGRVGLQKGGMVDAMEEVIEEPSGQEMTMQEETVEETVKPLSYQELRDRLPKEVNDDIVLLISKSSQAYLDFANIATQKDVLDFNNKYGVELVLPQV
jgi:hypothetical protein